MITIDATDILNAVMIVGGALITLMGAWYNIKTDRMLKSMHKTLEKLSRTQKERDATSD